MFRSYLYTVLVVAFGQTVTSATRISSLYSFASVITSVALGVVVRYVRVIKPFQIVGILLFTLAMGLLVKYRSGTEVSGMIGAQVVLGIGGGSVLPLSLTSLEADDVEACSRTRPRRWSRRSRRTRTSPSSRRST